MREYVGGAVTKEEQDREDAIVEAALANASSVVNELELGDLQKNQQPSMSSSHLFS